MNNDQKYHEYNPPFGQRQVKRHLHLLFAAVILAAVGCASPGGPPIKEQTIEQRGATVIDTCTAAIKSATEGMRAGKVTAAQNATIVSTCDGVVAAVAAAKATKDLALAQAKTREAEAKATSLPGAPK